MTGKYSQEYKNFFYYTRKTANMLGADVIDENFRICWRTYLVLLVINGSCALTFYNMYASVAYDNTWTEVLKALCVLGTAFKGYAKLISVLRSNVQYNLIYNEIAEIYAVYELKSDADRKCLSSNVASVKKLLFTLYMIIILTQLAVICVPVFYFVIFKERIFILPFFIPMIDYKTDFGYYFHSIVHVVCVVFGATGNTGFDTWCFTFAAHIPLIKNILKRKFDEMDEILKADAKDKQKVRSKLMEIFKWHQKYTEFCDSIRNLYFWIIFIEVTNQFVAIVATIVCILLGVWQAGPVFLGYVFLTLYMYCALGNLVEISNDDVILMIYDFCWYQLSVPEQKMILIMLRKAQQAESMSIGGVAPLSMNTALQLTKTCYTFSMMFNEFLNK